MKIHYYAMTSSEAGDRMQRIVEKTVPPEKRSICRSRDELIRLLRQPSGTMAVFILLAEAKDELNYFFMMRKQFAYFRIILILPDRSNESIAKGNALHPRYLDYIDSDFEDVCAVLHKMIGMGKKYEQSGNEKSDNDVNCLFPVFVRDEKGFRVEMVSR